jgi:2-dehydro-3-deoxygluconokinase
VKVVSFGEIMLRLNPPGHTRILQTPELEATFGGAEANVAVSLAQFGIQADFVTRVPENPLGHAVIRALRAEGVGVEHVRFGGERLGIYFVEKGASQRSSVVVYDRKGSALATAVPGEIDWARVLAGSSWLHTTGITPALSDGAAALTAEAFIAAKKAGAKVSLDLNFRSKLWSAERAQSVMRPLMKSVDLVIGNVDHVQTMLGIGAPASASGTQDVAACRALAERLAAEFPVELVALTLRESHSANENGWGALLYETKSKRLHQSKRYEIALVDRLGGGDSFAAGLIFGLVSARPLESALEFAVAASALKQTIVGDFNRVSIAEVEALVAGDASGRVQR